MNFLQGLQKRRAASRSLDLLLATHPLLDARDTLMLKAEGWRSAKVGRFHLFL